MKQVCGACTKTHAAAQQGRENSTQQRSAQGSFAHRGSQPSLLRAQLLLRHSVNVNCEQPAALLIACVWRVRQHHHVKPAAATDRGSISIR